MRKHLYFYSSNLQLTRELRQDDQFEGVQQYSSHEIELTPQNEYGRIKTNQNYYHFIFGRLSQKNCPWCDALPELLKVHESVFLERCEYCIQCMQCGSRGPILNINSSQEKDKNFMDFFKDIMWSRYNDRLAWDKDFVNPYENLE